MGLHIFRVQGLHLNPRHSSDTVQVHGPCGKSHFSATSHYTQMEPSERIGLCFYSHKLYHNFRQYCWLPMNSLLPVTKEYFLACDLSFSSLKIVSFTSSV